MNRPAIKDKAIQDAIKMVLGKMDYRLKEKGRGAFASRHEILGTLVEEMHELEDAVARDLGAVKLELLDIAVGAIFGLACIETESVDW